MENKEYILQNRLNTSKESTLFYKVFGLVVAGMMIDASDVYMSSAVNADIIAQHFATLNQGSIFLSAGFLGLFIGSIAAGFIGDLWGRKKAYQLNLLLFGIFTFIGAFSPSIYFLIFFRFIAACGLGAEIVTGYSLINEFAPVKTRGRWSGATAVIANLGAPLALLLATYFIPRYSWRSMFLFIGTAALILWVIRRHFPESPRWLISKGKYTEAEKIISVLELNGSYSDTSDHNAYQMKQSKNPNLKRGLFIATVAVSAVMISQYTFTSWAPTLLIEKGINIVHSLGYSMIMMTGAPVGALIGALLVDWIGRKKTIIPTFVISAILGLIYTQQTNPITIIAIGFLLTMTFYILMASVVGVYVSELFVTDFRFRGAGTANGIAKLLTVLTPYFATWAIQEFSADLIFYLIAIIMLIAAIVVLLFGPETKQQEIR